MIRRLVFRLIVLAVFGFLLAPVIVVVIASFNDGAILSFPPPAFTLRWYGAIKPSFAEALYVSLIVATVTALLSIAFAVPAVLALSRGTFRGRDAINAMLLSPLMVPALVTGVALYQFSLMFWDWSHVALSGTIAGLVLGHLTFGIPFVARALVAGHARFDYVLEEAALKSRRDTDANILARYHSAVAAEHSFRRYFCFPHVAR